MKYDFTDVNSSDNFINLPPGWYTVCVHEVREGRTRDGDPRWGLLLRVAEGDCAGRFAAWDGIVWSERGAHRAKQVLDAFELDTSGEIELAPCDLIGRLVDVELVPEEYEHPVTGRRQRRNRVPYEGYAVAGSANAALFPETRSQDPPKSTPGSNTPADAAPAGSVHEPRAAVDSWGGERESCSHESASDGTESVPY